MSTGKRQRDSSLPEWAVAVKALREHLALNQSQFARELGVTQSAVSLWESGGREPSKSLYANLWFAGYDSQVAPFFWARSGLSSQKVQQILAPLKQKIETAPTAKSRKRTIQASVVSADRPYIVSIPLLHDSAAAGVPRSIEEKDVDGYVYSDIGLCRGEGVENLVALRVNGDSMSPILEDGYIVVLNTHERDPSKLYGHMVAAVSPDGGVTIKWLRKTGSEPMLVPQHTSLRYPIVLLNHEIGWRIAGRVLFWIGKPK